MAFEKKKKKDRSVSCLGETINAAIYRDLVTKAVCTLLPAALP